MLLVSKMKVGKKTFLRGMDAIVCSNLITYLHSFEIDQRVHRDGGRFVIRLVSLSSETRPP